MMPHRVPFGNLLCYRKIGTAWNLECHHLKALPPLRRNRRKKNSRVLAARQLKNGVRLFIKIVGNKAAEHLGGFTNALLQLAYPWSRRLHRLDDELAALQR